MLGPNLCLALSLVLMPGAIFSAALTSPAFAESSKESKSDTANKKDSDKKELVVAGRRRAICIVADHLPADEEKEKRVRN